MTPTNSPTPTPPGIGVLPNHTNYVFADKLYIVGEVQNDSALYLRNVRVSASFFDAAGQLLTTGSTDAFLSNLPPQSHTCFNMSVTFPTGWASYAFALPSYTTDGSPLLALTVLNDSGKINPLGFYQVTGQIRNDQGTPVQQVKPIVTLYSSTHKVLGCAFGFSIPTDLSPGASGSFTMNLFGGNYTDASSYSVQVDGRTGP